MCCIEGVVLCFLMAGSSGLQSSQHWLVFASPSSLLQELNGRSERLLQAVFQEHLDVDLTHAIQRLKGLHVVLEVGEGGESGSWVEGREGVRLFPSSPGTWSLSHSPLSLASTLSTRPKGGSAEHKNVDCAA